MDNNKKGTGCSVKRDRAFCVWGRSKIQKNYVPKHYLDTQDKEWEMPFTEEIYSKGDIPVAFLNCFEKY